jgi:hypothetical protein
VYTCPITWYDNYANRTCLSDRMMQIFQRTIEQLPGIARTMIAETGTPVKCTIVWHDRRMAAISIIGNRNAPHINFSFYLIYKPTKSRSLFCLYTNGKVKASKVNTVFLRFVNIDPESIVRAIFEQEGLFDTHHY